MTGRVEQFRLLYRKLRIEDQQRYYKDRCTEYQGAHKQAAALRDLLLLLAAVTGLVGQSLDDTARAAAGVVAAMLAALAAALTAFEALIGFEQLAKLFGDAKRSLDQAQRSWDAGASRDLRVDIERVEQIFRSENGQWGQLVMESATAEPGTPPETGG
jgi:hypothetical protein